MAQVVMVKRVTTVTVAAADLQDGVYQGTWGGYLATINYLGGILECATDIGIRTPSAPCVMIVKDGKSTVEVVKQ